MKTEKIRKIFREELENFFTSPQELSKAEAARKLGISRPTLYERIKAGMIKENEAGKIELGELIRFKSTQ